MAQSMPSGTNTFIPQMVQDNLIVGFARNKDDYSVNKYVQIIPTPKNRAYYMKIDGSTAVRLTNTDLRNIVWPDGQKRPDMDNDVAEFEFVQIDTKRHNFGFTVGQLAVEQAQWDVVSTNAGFAANRAMVARTIAVHTALSGASWGDNTATATVAGGGKVDTGTATDPRFKKAKNYAAQQIRKATFGAVKANDLICVMAPKVAEAIAASQEIHSYIKESPFALAQLRGDAPNQNANWGLPESLYGTRIIIDDAFRVSSKRNATTTTTVSVFDEDTIYFLSRPGGMVMPYGGVSFSTVQLFVREEMNVEAQQDTFNRRIQGAVADDYGAYVVAPASGYKLTDVL